MAAACTGSRGTQPSEEIEVSDDRQTSRRRSFFASLGAAATALGLDRIVRSANAADENGSPGAAAATPFEAWLASFGGKHRQVYDMPSVNSGRGLIWSHVYLVTGAEGYGVPEKDLQAVVVMRHDAIPAALVSDVWAKYKLGEFFKVDDPATKAPSTRNFFYQSRPGDIALPEAAIDRLLERGVKFAVCNAALTNRSAAFARQHGLEAAAVKKDWIAGVFPGIHVAPSGVVALNGAQAHGCSYVFAG